MSSNRSYNLILENEGDGMLNGSRLREVRKAKGLTQGELGDLIGVGKSAICCYEKETRNPTLEAVLEMIHVFGVSADYLLGADFLVQTIDKDGNEISFLDILKTPNPDFAMDIHNQNNISLLSTYFSVLTEREKEIVEKRYGLNNQEERTQKEIAKELGISRSYVSRIEKRALTKMLREFIKNKNQTE